MRNSFYQRKRFRGSAIAYGAVLALGLCAAASAQDRDRGDYRVRTLDPGSVIAVRTNESIDVDKGDNRIYRGVVDQDVRNDHDHLVIPRGSPVELILRIRPDNDLILDLESVVINGQRYGIRAEPNRMEARRDNSVVGDIMGAIDGGQARGRAVRVPRDSVVTFRLARPLEVGVEDRGTMRDGRHYHDYDQPDRQ